MDQSLANQGAFGVQSVDTIGSTIIPGKRIRFEMGGYVRFQFQHEIFKNVNFTSKLGLFSNYLERPERIDVN